MVNFTLRQVTSIVDGPAYQVINEVTLAQGASSSAYVYATVNQKFSHYATAADFEQWPTSYEEAVLTNAVFYRLPKVARTWDTVSEMNEDLAMSLRRLQSLADELNQQQGALVIDRTTTVQGG